MRRFPDPYVASVKTADGRLLHSSREIRDAFRAHFRDRFARCPDLPIREFRSYLADLPRLRVAEAASCEGVVTKCEVRDALKQVGLNKSPGLDGLPYEVYLRKGTFGLLSTMVANFTYLHSTSFLYQLEAVLSDFVNRCSNYVV